MKDACFFAGIAFFLGNLLIAVDSNSVKQGGFNNHFLVFSVRCHNFLNTSCLEFFKLFRVIREIR